MTRLVLEIPNQKDLDLLLPLLQRLQIRYENMAPQQPKDSDIEEAIRIVRLGCNMSTFGDALKYQIETRQDRLLPFRD